MSCGVCSTSQTPLATNYTSFSMLFTSIYSFHTSSNSTQSIISRPNQNILAREGGNQNLKKNQGTKIVYFHSDPKRSASSWFCCTSIFWKYDKKAEYLPGKIKQKLIWRPEKVTSGWSFPETFFISYSPAAVCIFLWMLKKAIKEPLILSNAQIWIFDTQGMGRLPCDS